MATYDDDLRLTHVLADAIERTALDGFGQLDPEAAVDDDGRLRTATAARLEELIGHHLSRTRPRDGVQGRTLQVSGREDRRWVLDTLDGSANYLRGVPIWATLISLVIEGEPVLGLIAAPSLSRRWWAGLGSGCWTGRTLAQARQVQVSDTAVLEHASVSADDIAGWMFGSHGQGFAHLADRAWRTRAYGDFWSHALLAEGAVDVALAAHLDRFQIATLLPLITEAGGRVSDPSGADLDRAHLSDGATVLATNGVLHPEVVAALEPVGPQG